MRWKGGENVFVNRSDNDSSYSQLSLRQTPLGPVLSVPLSRKMSVL